MNAIYGTGESVDIGKRLRIVSNRLTTLWGAFQASRKRRQIRTELYALSDRELADVGIAHGEIEHVVLCWRPDHLNL